MSINNILLKRLPILLLAGFITFAPFNAYASKKTLLLATHNHPPYGYYPTEAEFKTIADNSFQGTAINNVRCALDKIKYSYEIHVMPWPRVQLKFKNGEIDGFFAASQNKERDSIGVRSEVIAGQKWQWFLLKNSHLSPQQKNFKKNARVGGYIGSNMLNWLEENEYNITLRVRNTKTLLDALLMNRADAVLANNHLMHKIIKEQNLEDQVKYYTQQEKPLSVYISKSYTKKNPNFMKIFNAAIINCMGQKP